MHYVKSVRIRSCSSPYLVRMRENTDQTNSKYGHFLWSMMVKRCYYSREYRRNKFFPRFKKSLTRHALGSKVYGFLMLIYLPYSFLNTLVVNHSSCKKITIPTIFVHTSNKFGSNVNQMKLHLNL